MKKITMLALAAVASIAFSCSDDDNQTTDMPALTGKWKLISVTANRAIDANEDGTSSTDLISELGSCYSDSYVEFGDNNAISTHISLAPEEGTTCNVTTEEGIYEMVQYKVQMTSEHTDGTRVHSTYIKTGNLLTLTIPGITQIEVDIDGDGVFHLIPVDAQLVFEQE